MPTFYQSIFCLRTVCNAYSLNIGEDSDKLLNVCIDFNWNPIFLSVCHTFQSQLFLYFHNVLIIIWVYFVDDVLWNILFFEETIQYNFFRSSQLHKFLDNKIKGIFAMRKTLRQNFINVLSGDKLFEETMEKLIGIWKLVIRKWY